MKQVLVREMTEYDLRDLFEEDYGDALCDELYEKSRVIKKNLGLRMEPILIQRGKGRGSIKFSSIAGVLSLKHIEIEIMPKFYNQDDLWRENLFAMISWANSGRMEAQKFSNMKYTIKNIYDHIGRLYVEELEYALNRELIRSYRSVEENSRFLRGRILITEEMRHILSSPGIVWYERDGLDYENEYNYILKWCTDFLHSHCKDKRIKNRLRMVRERIPATVNRYSIPVHSKLPPQYSHYTRAIEIANHVALKKAIDELKVRLLKYIDEVVFYSVDKDVLNGN